ncbi:MAG: hypothetical protein JSR59_16310 [Proteobacteria bacterium]|nr:hypothetical protein [Pseudomonadota bacterium]
MKTAFKVCGLLLLVALLLSIGLVVACAHWLLPLDHGVLTIDDESITLGALHGADWLIAIVGVLVALLVAVLVVPIAIVLPLLVAAFALGLVLLAVLGVVALVFSPLLLAVWLVWLLVRPARPRAPAGATMAA